MNQPPAQVLKRGTKIRTSKELDERTMSLHPVLLANRKPNADGEIHGIVPGYGGDVYFVKHPNEDGGAIAPYIFTEFELAAGLGKIRRDALHVILKSRGWWAKEMLLSSPGIHVYVKEGRDEKIFIDNVDELGEDTLKHVAEKEGCSVQELLA